MASPTADGGRPSRVRRSSPASTDSGVRTGSQCVERPSTARRTGGDITACVLRRANSPNRRCVAATCERGFATARPHPRRSSPPTGVGKSTCAECATRRVQLARRMAFCYLCRQGATRNLLTNHWPGVSLKHRNSLETLAVAGFPASCGALAFIGFSTAVGVSLSHAIHRPSYRQHAWTFFELGVYLLFGTRSLSRARAWRELADDRQAVGSQPSGNHRAVCSLGKRHGARIRSSSRREPRHRPLRSSSVTTGLRMRCSGAEAASRICRSAARVAYSPSLFYDQVLSDIGRLQAQSTSVRHCLEAGY